MKQFVSIVDGEYRKGHFSEVWGPRKPQRPCLLSLHSNLTPTPAILTAPAAPNVHTISGLQQALKMLGYRIVMDGDYGRETRHTVMTFQMKAGLVADGVAGAQTEAKLLRELNNRSRSGTCESL
jgi:murein L,D-transpeptidase YcbB/YkuD